MRNQQDANEHPEQKNETDSLSAREQQNQSDRRLLLKAAWVAPVVFSIANHQAAFAGIRRR